MTKSLKERISTLQKSIEEINELNDQGEDFDYSITIDNMNEALNIIKELLSKENKKKLNQQN
ncbi:MAG: hypothetical protein EBS06_05530 [Proteobacteria bacterium]|nr:hypothetical protein [Pseudomonadota bacterium]